MRLATLKELAADNGQTVPDDIRFFAGMGLDAALSRFAFTVGALQSAESVRRVASEICEDAEGEGVTRLEIRFAPQLHGDSTEIVDAVVDGIDGRAGLILCGLYGEDPSLLSGLVRLAEGRPAVVGIDLAGGPSSGHSWSMVDYREPFEAAAAVGLGRTVHASEGRPPDEIRTAIEILGAQRIGHGTTLLDDPEVLALVLERGVTIEACPTSNVHTGAIDSVASHPLAAWLDAGVSACVCPDNTLLSDVTAADELDRVCTALQLSSEQRQRLIDCGHRAAFRR